MIDEKKIEEAATKHMNAVYNDEYFPVKISEIKEQCESDFKQGAHWAMQEFLKDLWHDAEEEPKEFANVVAEVKITDSIKTYISFKRNDALFKDWDSYIRGAGITQWCYIDDILPKQKGVKLCQRMK